MASFVEAYKEPFRRRHPDKICDQVADAILDECLKQNPLSKVAIEVAVRPGLVIVFGVVHFIPQLDIDAIVRFVLKDIGYTSPDQELDYRTCQVMDCVELHPSLFNGISSGLEAPDDEPAGDQVTVEYVEDEGRMVPTRVHNVVITAQHTPGVPLEKLRQGILDKVVRKSIPAKYLDDRTAYHVDRSAAYMARWIAKSLVHHGLAHRCLIQLSYSIGIAEPLSIFIDTFKTSKFTSDQLKEIIRKNFDLRPAAIAKDLNLIDPIYYQTAKNGHFTNEKFPWEQPLDLVL
ncbi:unnamed protein product [Aspergillus oryzae var. brunneus]|uniref:Unnamed protein product n=1 Tax=Aspergillus oryzae var. brunneus TaxID=332754 RepID=A0ABQ6KD94_ASPOZ|nr:unnamed protein product [Aspergillus oryzae var. brunneus]